MKECAHKSKYLTNSSKIRHEDFCPSGSSVTLWVPPLDSARGWTGELWSNPATTTITPMSRSGYPPWILKQVDWRALVESSYYYYYSYILCEKKFLEDFQI